MDTDATTVDSEISVAPNAENVFVAVRLRPLSQCEICNGEADLWDVEGSRCLVLKPGHKHCHNKTEFIYDRAFESGTDSVTVYDNVARPMVDSAMRGMNATIFAYGQTGSGKTHTMKAVMELASQQMFKHIQDDLKREFFIRVSVIEIYNEIVKDLLAPEEAQASLRIMDDQEKGPVVEGLSEEGVSSIEHMEQLLKIVQLKRQVRETKLNDCSSRSHTIVRINVESRLRCCTPTSEEIRGSPRRAARSSAVTISTINFVDLAGSERSKECIALHDQEERTRLKEGCHINKSLLALGTVIRCLVDAPVKKYIPYRDSRLTRILQPSLSGNSRMAIICTISPASGVVETSKVALHFATCAKQVKMQPKVNEIVDSKAMMKRLQAEIVQLRQQLSLEQSLGRKLLITQQPTNVSELSAYIKQKLEVFQATAKDCDALLEPLHSLENLNPKDQPSARKRRVSWSGSMKTYSKLWSSCPPECRPSTIQNNSHDALKEARCCTGLESDKVLENKHNSEYEQSICSWMGERPSNLKPVNTKREIPRCERVSITSLSTPEGKAGTGFKHDGNLSAQEDFLTVKHSSVHSQNLVDLEMAADECGSPTSPAVPDLTKLHKNEEDLAALAAQALDSLEQQIESLCLKYLRFTSSENELTSIPSKSQARQCFAPVENCPSIGQTQSSVVLEFHMPCGSSPTSPEAEHCQRGNQCCFPGNDGNHTSVKVTASTNLGSGSKQWQTLDSELSDTHNSGRKTDLEATNQLMREWFRKELEHIQGNIRRDTHKEFACLRSCLKHYGNLALEKQILQEQSLQLGLQIEKTQKEKEELQGQLWDSIAEHDQLHSENSYLKQELEVGRSLNDQKEQSISEIDSDKIAVNTETIDKTIVQLSDVCIMDKENWADSLSVEKYLPKIVQLWSELFTPLARRSKFLLSFRGRDLFYYEMEYRRLVWERSQLPSCLDEDAYSIDLETASISSKSPALHPALIKAKRRVYWERRYLALQLKYCLAEDRRNQLYQEWGVRLTEKGRKLKLINKLFNDEPYGDSMALMKTAELVLQLHGPDYCTDGECIMFRPAPEDHDLPWMSFFNRLSRRLKST